MKISDGMIQKLDKIEARCNEVGQLLSMPENISDQEKFKALSKEHSDLMPICEIYSVYKKHKKDFDDCEAMAAAETDPDMRRSLNKNSTICERLSIRTQPTSKSPFCPKTPTRTTTSLWKYARAQAATRRLCSEQNL